MRVLFASWAWPSHYYPMVPLAWAFRAAGAEVRVASQPGLQATIRASGLPGVSVGTDVDVAGRQRPQLERVSRVRVRVPLDQLRVKITRAFQVFADVAEVMLDDLLRFGRSWRPDLVVYEPTTYAGPLVAAALGVPAVRHTWGVDYTFRVRDYEPAVLAPLCDRLGLDGVETLGAATVDVCPPSLQVPTEYRRLRTRYIPYNGSGRSPAWLSAPPRRPRVCMTWGTSSTRLDQNLFLGGQVVKAIADLDAEVVLAVTPADHALLRPVPDGLRVAESLPLHLLAPSCDLVIHQGGLGTTLTTASAGVPQLVIPQLHDQGLNATQLAGAGAGAVVYGDEATPELIREQALRVLGNPGYRVAAQTLAEEISRQPAPHETVSALREL
ncbi:nucleotide disphospho-sugar-binding domain-containing protein [Crossiella sp. NPDC003009]